MQIMKDPAIDLKMWLFCVFVFICLLAYLFYTQTVLGAVAGDGKQFINVANAAISYVCFVYVYCLFVYF